MGDKTLIVLVPKNSGDKVVAFTVRKTVLKAVFCYQDLQSKLGDGTLPEGSVILINFRCDIPDAENPRRFPQFTQSLYNVKDAIEAQVRSNTCIRRHNHVCR
jgi:hypothetical protein